MRASDRNHGRALWLLVAALFAASLTLVGWMVLANWIDAAPPPAASHWTPRQIARDHQEFLRLCQNDLNAISSAAEAQIDLLLRRRSDMARAIDEAQPRLRLAAQKRLELKAVYEWASSTGRWPARYGNDLLDENAFKASLVGAVRYMESLRSASGRVPQSLSLIDARLAKLVELRGRLEATAASIRADLAAPPPPSQELVDRLGRLAEQIQSLRRGHAELAGPIELSLPEDVPADTFEEAEFARALAGDQR